MQAVTVTLAGKAYQIEPLPMRPSRAFRERISGQIGGLAQALDTAGKGDVELSDLSGIAALIERLGGTLAGSVDLIADLLFDYSPALQADRERIEAEAFDEEIIAAFGEVLKLLYPFGGILSSLTGPGGRRT